MTVRHKGFAPLTKYVTFDKSLDTALDLKMVASADDGMSEPAQAAEPAPGKLAVLTPKQKGTLLADVTIPEPGEKKPRAREKDPEPKEELAPVKAPAVRPEPPVKEAPKGNEPGFLVANTQPWAKVLIDGKDTGSKTPQKKIKLTPGIHAVTVTSADKAVSENFTVEIKSGATVTEARDLKPKKKPAPEK